MKIDLNSDLGESFGRYRIGRDEAIIPLVSSVNIACGFHAGDPVTMERTVDLALAHRVKIGAHPGYRDLEGFGRRDMQLSHGEVRALLLYQIGALDAFVRAKGGRLHHVKPHGALYNRAAKDMDLARVVVDAVGAIDPELVLYGLSGSCLERAAREADHPFASEVFADRQVTDDGYLVNRSETNAVIHSVEICAERVLRMIEKGEVESVGGQVIPMRAETICVHGDHEEALAFVRSLRTELEKKGVVIA